MRTKDFDYHLPAERIAQRPANPRDSSRLLILDRKTGKLQDRIFHDLPQFLTAGDALVLNQTKVIPARLRARKIPTGGRVELLLLKRLSSGTWETMVGGKGIRTGLRLAIEAGPEAEIIEDLGGPRRVVQFEGPVRPHLERIGEMPLPPYIHTPLERSDEYQTVFARDPGSAAAPTAGLHFTPDLLDQITEQGVKLIYLTLHIGLDTFAPVTEDDPQQHPIHSEWCEVSPSAADEINRVRLSGGRIIAVGTTSVRTLESAALRASPGQTIGPIRESSNLFILPGHEFRAVDALLTNFHLPRSTLLMLVSAFAGREQILAAYRHAIEIGYRFYSFGDAMLLI